MSHKELFAAIEADSPDQVRALLLKDEKLKESCYRFGAIPKLYAKTGYRAASYFHTPLQWAAMMCKSGRIVRTLLHLGCNVNNMGPLGASALHIACKYANSKGVEALLEASPNLQAKDGRGRTPKEVCRSDTIQALLEDAELQEQQAPDFDWVVVEVAENDKKGHVEGCSCLACMSRGEEILSRPPSPPPTPRYRFGDITRSLIKIVARRGIELEESTAEDEAPGNITSFGLVPFDEIELINKIGSGGYGTVYDATWRGMRLAAKVLNKRSGTAVGRNEEDASKKKEEILHEIRIFSSLAECQHPNIIAFIGACSVGKHLCLCTEFASGGSLYQYMHGRTGTPYNMETVRRWGLEIAAGMDYLAGRGIVHRDLKSPNILLCDASENLPDDLLARSFQASDLNSSALMSRSVSIVPVESFTCKICDFGLARELKEMADVETSGTFRWMPPEAMTNGSVTSKSDVYSYGVVLWEIVTRELPFNKLNPGEVIFSVVEHDTRPPIPDTFPPALEQLIRRCWHKSQDERPTFASALKLLRHCDLTLPQSAALAQQQRLLRQGSAEEIASIVSMGSIDCSWDGGISHNGLQLSTRPAPAPSGPVLNSGEDEARSSTRLDLVSVNSLVMSQEDWSRQIAVMHSRLPGVSSKLPPLAGTPSSEATVSGPLNRHPEPSAPADPSSPPRSRTAHDQWL